MAPPEFPILAGTFTNLLYHVVFSTRQRRPLITEKIERSLHKPVSAG